MAFKCKIGLHSWNGCKCSECGKIRNKQHDWSKDFDKCSKCGGTKVTYIRVKILNNSVKGPESFFRKATGQNTSSLFRPAQFTSVLDEIELSYRDDLNNYNSISKLQFSKIKSAKYKTDAISLKSQILKPVSKGFVFSIFFLIIGIFFSSAISKIGFVEMFGFLAVFPIFYAIKGLIEMERVSIIIIESIDSKEMSFVINDESFEALSNLLKVRNIEFEDFNLAKMKEPISIIDSTLESIIKKLKELIDYEKDKNVFKKSRRNEIFMLIQKNCTTKSDSINLLDSYRIKFKSNLIEDLRGISSSYDSIKEILQVFIEFNIVDKNYPHDLIE